MAGGWQQQPTDHLRAALGHMRLAVAARQLSRRAAARLGLDHRPARVAAPALQDLPARGCCGPRASNRHGCQHGEAPRWAVVQRMPSLAPGMPPFPAPAPAAAAEAALGGSALGGIGSGCGLLRAYAYGAAGGLGGPEPAMPGGTGSGGGGGMLRAYAYGAAGGLGGPAPAMPGGSMGGDGGGGGTGTAMRPLRARVGRLSEGGSDTEAVMQARELHTFTRTAARPVHGRADEHSPRPSGEEPATQTAGMRPMHMTTTVPTGKRYALLFGILCS